MKLNEAEKKAIEMYTFGSEQITDLGEALSLLNTHGEKCEKAIHRSIREEAWKSYKENT